jgi:hypothetical protein
MDLDPAALALSEADLPKPRGQLLRPGSFVPAAGGQVSLCHEFAGDHADSDASRAALDLLTSVFCTSDNVHA